MKVVIMEKTIEIPEGYEARIEDNRVILKLKESEDERIRKELVDFIQKEKEYMEDKVKPENSPKLMFLMDALAYLERQKEQQPAEKLSKEECVKKFKALCDAYEIKLPNREYDIYGLCEDLHKLFGDIQKPAEWRDTDMNEARNNLISVCRDWERGEHTTLLPVAAVHARYFLEHLTEPKPAEWSDGDEGMLNCIITTLCEESHGGREANGKMVTWLETRLKLLRPQPHWKPSKEQMEALENVIKCELSSGLHARAEILQTLWNDFKKL